MSTWHMSVARHLLKQLDAAEPYSPQRRDSCVPSLLAHTSCGCSQKGLAETLLENSFLGAMRSAVCYRPKIPTSQPCGFCATFLNSAVGGGSVHAILVRTVTCRQLPMQYYRTMAPFSVSHRQYRARVLGQLV